MDKKELLKRWALAYTEPSLFYVPWKKKEKEGYLRIVCSSIASYDESNTIIGGIFDLNGKLISKVTFPNSHWFENCLMEGTYVYKEAVSPKSYELSDDIIFTVHREKTTVIRLNHTTRISYFKRTYEKIDPTLYYPVTPSEPYSIYEFEHYAYFDWVLRQYKSNDGELLRTIYNVKNSNYIHPSKRYSYSNSISQHSYFFKAIDEIYNGQKRNRIEFEYDFEDDIQSQHPIWNDRDFGNSTVKQAWSGKHISCSVESIANNSDKALWINSVTAEEILNIYKFIVDNQIPPSSTSTKAYYWMYNIWVYNGQYYGSGAECEYKGFPIPLIIYYRQTDLAQIYPEEMLLSENTDFSADYIIKNNVDDLSKYFNNAFLYVHSNTKDLCMYPDSVIINQELLDIINNSESGGES